MNNSILFLIAIVKCFHKCHGSYDIICKYFFVKLRLLLIQEKEQLLRELRSINLKGRSESEVTAVQTEISKLEQELGNAMEMSNRAIADR